jgi:hypothetical protein
MGGQPGKPSPPGNPPIRREPDRPLVEEPPRPIPVPPVQRLPPPMQAAAQQLHGTRPAMTVASRWPRLALRRLSTDLYELKAEIGRKRGTNGRGAA